MSFFMWDKETKQVYKAIKDYRRACDKYLDGKPSPEFSSKQLEIAKNYLIQTLQDPVIKSRLQTVIDAGVQNDKSVNAMFNTLDDLNFDSEIDLSDTYGLKKREVIRSLPERKHVKEAVEKIDQVDEIISKVENFHKKLVVYVQTIRKEKPRILKKQGKTNAGRSATSFLFGIGCFVGNSYALPYEPTMAGSYAVGLSAFHQAARDIMKDPDNE